MADFRRTLLVCAAVLSFSATGTDIPPSRTYVNPLDLPYRMRPESENGFREAADPEVVVFEGKYWLFASKCGGYFVSDDMLSWTFVASGDLPIEGYAPSVVEIGGKLYYGYNTGTSPIFESVDPLKGVWKKVADVPLCTDLKLFQDAGRLYIYAGAGESPSPIGVRELDVRTFAEKGGLMSVFEADNLRYGYEVGGNGNDDFSRPGYLEGSNMLKADGRYYFQYAGPGTQYDSYADVAMVGRSPTGPFVRQRLNPFSQKLFGYAKGAGHGCTFRDLHGNFWHMTSCTIFGIDRRLVLFPVFFDADGEMWCDTAYADWPMAVPDRRCTSPEDYHTGWLPLTEGKTATASSNGGDAAKAADGDARTIWCAGGAAGEWLCVDLGAPAEVRAVQVGFAECDAWTQWRRPDAVRRYRIEATEDGKVWTTVVDASAATDANDHPYCAFDRPVRAKALRLTCVSLPEGARLAVRDLRAFGRMEKPLPARPQGLSVVRAAADRRRADIRWTASPDASGYVVRFGPSPDKRHLSYVVRGTNELTVRCLDTAEDYFWSVTAYNEAGFSEAATAGAVRRIGVVGDSVTHQCRYLSFLQLMHDLKRPDEAAEFRNYGIAWDDSAGALRRFDAEILPAQMDEFMVMLGMNDFGDCYPTSGELTPEDKAAGDRRVVDFGRNMAQLVDKFKAKDCGLTLMTPTPYDEYTPVRWDGDRIIYGNERGLGRLAQVVRDLASEKNCGLVELHAPLTVIAKANPGRSICGGDRVHPDNLSAALVAMHIAREIGISCISSRVEFDASGKSKYVTQYRPSVLPLPSIPDADALETVYPSAADWRSEIVAVKGLPAGRYSLKADSVRLGAFTADELSEGVNVGVLDTPNRVRAQQAFAKADRLRIVSGTLRNIAFVHHWGWVTSRGGNEQDVEDSCRVLLEWKKSLTDGFYRSTIDDYVEARPKQAGYEAELDGLYGEIRELAQPVSWTLSAVPVDDGASPSDGETRVWWHFNETHGTPVGSVTDETGRYSFNVCTNVSSKWNSTATEIVPEPTPVGSCAFKKGTNVGGVLPIFRSSPDDSSVIWSAVLTLSADQLKTLLPVYEDRTGPEQYSIKSFTYELVVRRETDSTSADVDLIHMMGAADQLFTLTVDANGGGTIRVDRAPYEDYGWEGVSNSKTSRAILPRDGKWHHIAVTYDDGGSGKAGRIRIYGDYECVMDVTLVEDARDPRCVGVVKLRRCLYGSFDNYATMYVSLLNEAASAHANLLRIDEFKVSDGALEPSEMIRIGCKEVR